MRDDPQRRGDDPRIVEGFRRGDAEVFQEVVALHRQTIYAVAWRLLGSHADADEAAQLAFLRAWRARERFRGEASLRTWLTRIVLNVGKSMLASRRPPAVDADDVDLVDPAPSADLELRAARLRREVRRAVEHLPRRQREVVVLKVFSEMTYREVAATMQLSEGAVKAHLHQAVANLRRLMAAPAGEEVVG